MDINLDWIIQTVQTIVNQVHQATPPKTEIEVHDNRIALACPYCGDSHKNPHKKRGNLYFDSLFFYCFNEGCSASLTKMMSDFNLKLDLEQKLAVIEFLEHQQFEFRRLRTENYNFSLGLDKLPTIERLKDIIAQNNNNSGLTKIIDLTPTNRVAKYLKNRKVKNWYWFRSGIWRGFKGSIEPVLLIINHVDEKVISWQIRNLGTAKNRWFQTWNTEKIFELLPPEERLTPEEISWFNRLSNFHGLLATDPKKIITVFEGAIDASFYKNSIALTGATKSLNKLIKSDLNLRYFFDYDDIGLKTARKLANQDQSVFMWTKFLTDMKMTSWLKKDKVDLNDLVKYNPKLLAKTENYFSLDMLDSYYI